MNAEPPYTDREAAIYTKGLASGRRASRRPEYVVAWLLGAATATTTLLALHLT